MADISYYITGLLRQPTAAKAREYLEITDGGSGTQGPQGAAGADGAQGNQGFQGTQGNQGFQGFQGNQGFQGFQGNQGFQGTQGNQGTQGVAGASPQWGIQGTQHPIDTNLANIGGVQVNGLAASATYEYEARLGVQSSTTAGIQYCLQCSVAGGTMEGQIFGFQIASGSQGMRGERQTTQGAQSSPFTLVNGTGVLTLCGIFITPGSACALGVQAKKVTSGTGAVFANSFLRVTRIS